MRRRLRACCFALIVSPLLGAAPVGQIQAILVRPKVLCGSFDQSKRLAGLKKPVSSSGRFCVVADKGVLWRSLRPFPSTLRLTRDEVVQMHGDRVALRIDSRREPAVGMVNSVLFALLAGDLDQLEKFFHIQGSIQDGVWSVKLEARDPVLAKSIRSISLEGGAHVKSIAVEEAGGDHTKIVFSAIETGDRAMSDDEAALF